MIIKYLRQPTTTPYCPGIKWGMGRSQDVGYVLEKSSYYYVNINDFKMCLKYVLQIVSIIIVHKVKQDFNPGLILGILYKSHPKNNLFRHHPYINMQVSFKFCCHT